MLNCMPPLATATICTTPVVTTEEEELDTDDELLKDDETTLEDRLDDRLADEVLALLGVYTSEDVAADQLVTDDVDELEELAEDTGTTTPVCTLSSPGFTISVVPSLKVTFLALTALAL